MVDKPDKWVQLVADLIERTQENRIKWSSYVPTQNTNVKVVYRTTHKDKGLRLYKVEPHMSTGTAPSAGVFGFRERVVLEIIDSQQDPVWKVPDNPAVNDLLEAVRYQVAGVDEFLSDLLKV